MLYQYTYHVLVNAVIFELIQSTLDGVDGPPALSHLNFDETISGKYKKNNMNVGYPPTCNGFIHIETVVYQTNWTDGRETPLPR